jgi:four helix bundle protein
MDLAVATDEATNAVPDTERYGLIAQMRRAGVSVPLNIAEGQARRSTADFIRYLLMAHGSLGRARDAGAAVPAARVSADRHVEPLLESSAEVGRVLNGLIAYLRPD